jgi:hypothetical protein
MTPYKHYFGQTVTTDVPGLGIDRAFLAHYHITAAQAAAESDDGILAATDLNATARSITTGLSNPAVPRNVKVKGNASGINNAVKIYGTNFAGEAISEEITPNGETAVAGALAFKTITKVDLPVEDHTAAKQKTTSAVSAATGAGTAVLLVKGALFGEDGIDVSVVLAAGDVVSTTTAATAVKNALNNSAAFAAHFVATSSTNSVIMEAKVAAPQDATVDLTVKAAGDTGLVIGSITVDTVSGVRDRISVGWGKAFGIPYKLTADELVILKMFNNAVESTAGTVTADATDLAKNVYTLHSGTTPDGLKPIDMYILV